MGRDGRLSGPSLVTALIRGLVASGVEVIDIGLATTPMLYFAASTLHEIERIKALRKSIAVKRAVPVAAFQMKDLGHP